MENLTKVGLVTEASKSENDKQWYKDILDLLDHTSINSIDTFSFEEETDDQINYDLFNGIIDRKNFEYIYSPFGEETGELPAEFTNKDIVSPKIKVILGIENSRVFNWSISSVDGDSIVEKDKMKLEMIKKYVVQQIMLPIRQEIELKYLESEKGRKLTPEEQQQIQQQIQQELEAKTPPEIETYMKRTYKDTAEILMERLLQYTIKEQKIADKTNNGMKDATLTALEVYWIGEYNRKPVVKNINTLNFSYDKSNGSNFIEDGEWAGVEMWLSPIEIVSMIGDELSEDEIKSLYDNYSYESADEWSFNDINSSSTKIRVLHRAWKALRKIGFFSYVDETGVIQTELVDETFRVPKEVIFVDLVWEWIPAVYEGYKIGQDIYTKLRMVAGQSKNIDNLYESHLPYIGGIYDTTNSKKTSLMDRMKPYQWYYNMVMYRVDLLMASDKGKLLLMNIKGIPESLGIDMNKWLYYAEALKIGWVNPDEEGNKGTDVTNMAKEIDMSLISDIEKYIKLAEYVEQKCGQSIGVPREMEARINQYQAVKNTEQTMTQAGYIIEPYLKFHDIIKQNLLTHLVNLIKDVYANNDTQILNYILDDLSRETIHIDKGLLDAAQFGLFVDDNTKATRIKTIIEQIVVQKASSQQIELSAVIDTLSEDNMTILKEKMERSESEVYKKEMNKLETEKKNQEDLLNKEQEFKREEWKEEEKQIVIKEEERRETELQKQAILAMGFDENKDRNNNNIPDVLEVAKTAIDVDLKDRKQTLDEQKFEHQKQNDKEKNSIAKSKQKQK